jgi:hypothetical protein
MRYVNAFLGYLLLLLGTVVATSSRPNSDATAGAIVAVAGVALVATERVLDIFRSRRH